MRGTEEEGALTADVTSWQCCPIDNEPFFCRVTGTGSWNELLHSNHVATLIVKKRCPKEATEAQARFWQQQSLSTEYRKRHRYHKVGEEAFTALQRNGEVPEGIPRDRVWVAWCRSHELNKRYSFKAICKRLGRDPVTGKMAVKRNAQVPTEEEDGDGEEQECYSSDQEEEDDDYNLAPEEDSSSRPHQDPSLKWELSSRIPVILEGDLIPPPKPPILSDAENWGLALDLSQIKDTEDDSEGEGNTSTEETRQQNPDAKPHHDVVRFLSAWKTILMLLSPVVFERMRGVCKGLLGLVKSLERMYWSWLQYDFCNSRERQRYVREQKYPPAMRAIEMAINCSPICLETVHELEVYGGFIAKRFDIHCTTGQKPTPATLWPAIISTVEGVMRANTRPDTQLVVHHCPQEMVGTIIHAVMSIREPSNISLLTITGDGEITFPPGFRHLPPDSKRCLPRIELEVDHDRSCCPNCDSPTVHNNSTPAVPPSQVHDKPKTQPAPARTCALPSRTSARALAVAPAPAPALAVSNSNNGTKSVTVTGKRWAPGTPPLVLLPPPTTPTNAVPVENNRRRRLGW
ncbi:hypothetical protein Pelo_9098 [Pelomyxa schiedti]|nr:hypothetical protein Pelo_9098 [Pelomyxa schiedti]